MVADLDIAVFRSIRELLSFLDQQISISEKKFKDLSSILETAKSRKLKYEKLRKLLEEISGESRPTLSTTINISGLRIVIDPKPIEEFELLELACKAIQDRLEILKRIRELVSRYLEKYLGEEPVTIIAELRGNVPVKLLIKL